MTGNPKLTHAEHTARAMLLGRYYDWRDGTYCLYEINPDGSPNVKPQNMLDAMTLEPITDIGLSRMHKWGNQNRDIQDKRRPTPYADE